MQKQTPFALQTTRITYWATAAILTALSAGCGGGGHSAATPVTITANFATDSGGWIGGKADYSESTTPLDVITAPGVLPAPLSGSGYRLSGTNKSDDLFIYTKKYFTGLRPGARYHVAFQVKLATSAPMDCTGVGGAPGESVYVTAGATAQEPKTVKDTSGENVVNIDRGNQGTGGSQALVLGNIASTNSNCAAPMFEFKTLTPATTLTAQADAQGGLWLHTGIDSGFEAYSVVYLQSFRATFTPAD